MRATFALLLLVLATAAAGCCGPRPIRDRWCDAWNGRRNHQPQCEYQAAPAYQAPCCGSGGEVMIGP